MALAKLTYFLSSFAIEEVFRPRLKPLIWTEDLLPVLFTEDVKVEVPPEQSSSL